MASEAIPEHLISWGSMPPHPLSLAFLCMHTYTHTTHPCNPSSTNPGYGPAIDTMVLLLFKNGLKQSQSEQWFGQRLPASENIGGTVQFCTLIFPVFYGYIHFNAYLE